LRLSSLGGYGLALAALALVVFGAYDSYLKGRTQIGIASLKKIEASGSRGPSALNALKFEIEEIP